MLAREQGERWRDLGVDVNACTPGWIATKMGGAGTTSRYFYRRHEEKPNPPQRSSDSPLNTPRSSR
jgi:NAD(P)-dependent dehydrogenase (short-subunit alcohol dehydrogenase family)